MGYLEFPSWESSRLRHTETEDLLKDTHLKTKIINLELDPLSLCLKEDFSISWLLQHEKNIILQWIPDMTAESVTSV